MKALMYLGDQRLEVQDLPEAEGNFIVRILGCAVCGTDLKTYLKGHPYFKPPVILGHEAVGQVVKADAKTGFAPGDFCVVAPYGGCGTCAMCRENLGELCTRKSYIDTGMFCEQIAVPDDFVSRGVIKLESFQKAFSLTEPLACVLCGAEKIDLGAGSRLLVAGGGPMGALFSLLAMDMGIPVLVSEPSALRRDALSTWGIPCAPPDQVRFGDYNRAAIAVNKPEVAAEVVAGIAAGAKVNVFAGMPAGSVLSLDPAAVHYRAVTVTGSSGFALRHFHSAYGMIKANPGHYGRLLTDEYPFERAKEAFERLGRGESFKILLTP